jgi:hypothetical protein
MVPDPMRQNAASWEVADGMTVYGTDGEKLGAVRNYDPRAGYFDIQRGWLFHKDFYVTMSDVAKVDEHGIVLRLTKQELDDDRYTLPPTGGVAYGEDIVHTEKEQIEVVDEEVPVTRTYSGLAVY